MSAREVNNSNEKGKFMVNNYKTPKSNAELPARLNLQSIDLTPIQQTIPNTTRNIPVLSSRQQGAKSSLVNMVIH